MRPADAKKFKAIKGRVVDLRATHGEDVEKGRFAHMGLVVVTEMEFLIKLVERLDAGAADEPDGSEATEEATV